MNKIKHISHILQIIFKLLFVLLPIISVFYWFFATISNQEQTRFVFGLIPSSINIPDSLSFNARFLAFLVSSIYLSIVMWGIYCLIKLFKLYELGHIFTSDNVRYIRLIAITLIIQVFTRPFIEALLSLTLTMQYPSGQHMHMIAISFGNEDITLAFMGTIMFLASWIMKEACKLQEEQTLIV